MKILLSILFAFSVLNSSVQLDMPKSAIKKLEKSYAELWPGITINQKAIELTLEESKKLSFQYHNNKLYNLQSGAETLGYLYLAKAPSKFDQFDYAIIFDTDLNIMKVDVLVYREDYGGEIGSKRWLKQFKGKNSSSKVVLNDDIQGISGATISCRSATKGIHDHISFIAELKLKGYLH